MMTPEKQRITIAEACGWKSPTLPEVAALQEGWSTSGQHWLSPTGVLRPAHHMPDYLNDLNAMHEAEKVLNQEQKEDYFFIIFNFYGNWPKAIQATAAQRARAFLRVIGKWEGE